MKEEVWKDIKGWNGKYQISNHGRLKSHGGKFKLQFPDGYVTQGCIQTMGYRCVTLRGGHRDIFTRIRIHTLVGEHFIEKPVSESKLCINHKDGNKLNNYFENLEWVTHKENIQHAVRTGLFDKKGEKHFNVKLTQEKVIEMRRLRFIDKWTHQKIADKFGVSRRQAGDVINGVNWGWLKEGLIHQPA